MSSFKQSQNIPTQIVFDDKSEPLCKTQSFDTISQEMFHEGGDQESQQ